MDLIRRYSLYFAWLISVVGTLGAIYFGELSNVDPCPLCWYQRICLFPLVFILGVAAYREDAKIILYVIYQLVIGALFSLYQMVKDYLPFEEIPLCGSGGKECVSPELAFGISLPLVSFVAFIFIILLLLIYKPSEETKKQDIK